MNFKEALKKIEVNNNLIGEDLNGATIDEFIIYPTDITALEMFKKNYLLSGDAQKSVIPYMDSDVGVAVVCNKDWIRSQNVFLVTDLERLEHKFDIK